MLEIWKGVTDIFESVATALGIIVAGFWTFNVFIKTREKYPRAMVTQEVSAYVLSREKNLLYVRTRVVNSGKVLISMSTSRTRLQQIIPLPGTLPGGDSLDCWMQSADREVPWPVLKNHVWTFEKGSAELEPGESEVLDCDFVLDSTVRVVRLYSFVKNSSKRDIGWGCTMTIDIKREIENEEGRDDRRAEKNHRFSGQAQV